MPSPPLRQAARAGCGRSAPLLLRLTHQHRFERGLASRPVTFGDRRVEQHGELVGGRSERVPARLAELDLEDDPTLLPDPLPLPLRELLAGDRLAAARARLLRETEEHRAA